MTKIYLAGPVTGLTYEEASAWRIEFSSLLPLQMVALNPIGSETHLISAEVIPASSPGHPISNARSLVAKCRHMVQSCDVLVANLLGAKQMSPGTVVEIGWADCLRKPILLIMENEGNPHDRPLVTELAGWRVQSLPDALQVIRGVF